MGMGMGVAMRTAGGLMRVCWGGGTYRVSHFDEVINIDDSALQVGAGQVGLLRLLLRLLGSGNGHGLGDGRGQLLLLDLLGARHCCCGGFGGLAVLQLIWLRAGLQRVGLQSGGLVVNWERACAGAGAVEWWARCKVQGAGCSWCGGGGGVFGLML